MFSVGAVKFCDIGDRVRLLPRYCRFKGIDSEARRVKKETSTQFNVKEGLVLSGDTEYQVVAESNEGLFQIAPMGHAGCRSFYVQATWLASVHKLNVLTGRHFPFYVRPKPGDLVSIESPSFLGSKAVDRHKKNKARQLFRDGQNFDVKKFQVTTCSFTHMLFAVHGGGGALFDARAIWRLERDGHILVDRRCVDGLSR